MSIVSFFMPILFWVAAMGSGQCRLTYLNIAQPNGTRMVQTRWRSHFNGLQSSAQSTTNWAYFISDLTQWSENLQVFFSSQNEAWWFLSKRFQFDRNLIVCSSKCLSTWDLQGDGSRNTIEDEWWPIVECGWRLFRNTMAESTKRNLRSTIYAKV